MVKNAKIIKLDVDSRVNEAIRNSMDIYMNRLATSFIEIGLENAFQSYLSDILKKELDLNTFYTNERFIIKFEKNMPINANKDYIDIVIEYRRDSQLKLYLIELKFKKRSDSAPDLGSIESYKDIYNLDSHKQHTQNVAGCYFIFLTDYIAYSKQAKKGTRQMLPLHDGYVIKKDTAYNVTGKSALKNMTKYPNGFNFSLNYKIEYQYMKMTNSNTKFKELWFFILRI